MTGAVLASTGDCVLGDTIAFNISTQENDSEGENVDMQGISYNSLIPLIVNFTEVMDKLFNDSGVTLIDQLLQLPTPSSSTLLDPTDIPSPDHSLASHTVALIVVVVFLSVLVILILVIVGILFSRKRR